MYDFDMIGSIYEDYDDDFFEACEELEFDDLFTENEFGDCEYVGDLYTEAFGKKKKGGFSLGGKKKKKGGFSLGGKKKKKGKGVNLPDVAKVTAAVAAGLAVAAGIITVLKMIMRKLMKVDKNVDFTSQINDIKEKMKKLKKEHKEYVTGHKNLSKELKKKANSDYRNQMKEQRKELTIARLSQFCSNKLTIITALLNNIKKVGKKIAAKAESLGIPVPFKKKLNEDWKLYQKQPEAQNRYMKKNTINAMDVNQAISNVYSSKRFDMPATESAFIESVVNAFIEESAEYMDDDDFDDLYESYDEDYDDLFESYDEYEDEFEDLF